MPELVKSSWADEIEEESIGGGVKVLPSSTEKVQNGMKIITDYRFNQDDKIEKVVYTYKIERRLVSKSIALRKSWKKYGDSEHDKPGINPATTLVTEETQMQFITSKEDADKPEESPMDKLKAEKSLMKCRTCGGDHWTLTCPHKDSIALSKLKPESDKLAPQTALGTIDSKGKPQAGKYVAPSLRDGAAKRGDAMSGSSRHDASAFAIRITNLSESTTDSDLQELIKPFGPINKLFLAKDKNTGVCKGFAYIHFRNRSDALCAIRGLEGYGYDHLILNADWSKPQN